MKHVSEAFLTEYLKIHRYRKVEVLNQIKHLEPGSKPELLENISLT